MKKQLIILLVFIASALLCDAQSAPSELLAQKIAQRMQDTLLLTGAQRDSIYTINLQLHTLKMEVRQQYSDATQLRGNLQLVENQRDSLYKRVLTEEQLFLYRQKKRNLVNNN